MIAELRRHPLWLGALATAMIAWGSCSDEFSHAATGWPNAVVKALGAAAVWPLDWILIVAGVALLCWVWWGMRPSETGDGDRPGNPSAILAAWGAPLLFAPPSLSADAVLYADLGWIMNQGQNPYVTGLATLGGPYAGQVDQLWAGHGVAYPPLTLLVNELIVRIASFHPYFGYIAMRLPALAAVAVVLWVLPKLAREVGVDARRAVWFGALNPMLVIHFLGGAHNDALMVAGSLVAVWTAVELPRTLVRRGVGERFADWTGLVTAAVLVGVAMALKQQAGLTILAVAGLPFAAELRRLALVPRLIRLGWRCVVAAAVTIGVFLAISFASGLGLGWTKWLDLMGLTGTPAPFSILGKGGALLIRLAGGDPAGFVTAVGLIANVTLLAVLAWIVIRFSDRPMAALGWAALALAVLGQSLHPWYTPWSFAVLALVPLALRQRRWSTFFLVAFVVWNAIQTVVWHSMP